MKLNQNNKQYIQKLNKNKKVQQKTSKSHSFLLLQLRNLLVWDFLSVQ